MHPAGVGPPQHHGYPAALKAARTLKRRIWIVLATAVVVTGASLGLSQRQQPLYRASSQVLLKYQNLASGLTGIQNLSAVDPDPARNAQTQTQIAMSPAVAQRVAARGQVPALTPEGFLRHASVTASTTSDTLSFAVTYSDPTIATRLSTLHAQQYIAYRQELDNAALVAARKELEGRIVELQASSLKDSALLGELIANEQQLRTAEALQTANASLLRPASSASKVQPKPVRNAALGIVLGLLLGIALAFLREALDTRVISSDEVGHYLGLPLLARLPVPSKKLRSSNKLVMLVDSAGADAEAFRMLRTNLDFVNIDRGARSIMISSALAKEGKSTTVSNLAVALARSGSRVALVDLDLRRPSVGRFFGIGASQPGVTSVALGRSTLHQALVEVYRNVVREGSSSNGNGRYEHRDGVLKVLVAGELPPDPGEFINTTALARVLDELQEAFDLVLIDTPPLLSVGDAAALSTRVDAMVVITRLKAVTRPTLQELSRALRTCPTVKLGYVATAAELEEGYGEGGYGYYGYSSTPYAPTHAQEASIV
jgi:capsular exopolysaccharide synthesis family protein